MDRPALQRVVYLLGPERVELRHLPVPQPGPGEILVRIGAATTCGTDVKVFRRGGHPRMLRVPTAFGHELAGTVAAVGPAPGVLQEAFRVAARRVEEYVADPRMPLFLWLRFITGQKLHDLYDVHFGVKKRDERRKVSLSPGAMPDASSVALASASSTRAALPARRRYRSPEPSRGRPGGVDRWRVPRGEQGSGCAALRISVAGEGGVEEQEAAISIP